MSYTRYFAIFNHWYIAYTLLYIRHTPCTCRIRGIVAIFNHWYIAYTLLYIRHSPCTCRIRGIGPYSTIEINVLIHIYTSDIHPAHVVYTVLGHIQPLIHSLYTLYISDLHHAHDRIQGIGPYSTNGDTYTLYTLLYIRHSLYMSYTRYWSIFKLIHSLYTFIHQTYTLYMSYTRYWAIFNHWYIAYTLLYITHTTCTCLIHAVLGHIQPVIHSLYTFIHQTYTLHMSYTWYWAIFNHWYIAYTLLYIRHSPCTCRIHGIGPYSTGDT